MSTLSTSSHIPTFPSIFCHASGCCSFFSSSSSAPFPSAGAKVRPMLATGLHSAVSACARVCLVERRTRTCAPAGAGSGLDRPPRRGRDFVVCLFSLVRCFPQASLLFSLARSSIAAKCLHILEAPCAWMFWASEHAFGLLVMFAVSFFFFLFVGVWNSHFTRAALFGDRSLPGVSPSL